MKQITDDGLAALLSTTITDGHEPDASPAVHGLVAV